MKKCVLCQAVILENSKSEFFCSSKCQQKNWYENNKEKCRIKIKNYYLQNKNTINKKNKEYRIKNKEILKEKTKIYYQKNKNTIKFKVKQYSALNKDKRNSRTKERRKNDIEFKLKDCLRGKLTKALKSSNVKKSITTLDLVGCSVFELKVYLESLFKKGMTWDNHGTHGWHIDHIKPCASFDLSDPEQQKLCFHYTNLQPLWWHENLSKGDKI